MQIYIHKDDHDFGPFSREAVLEYVKRGVFQPDDYAAVAGMAEWKPLGKLVGISESTDTERLLDTTRRAAPEMAEFMRMTTMDDTEAEPEPGGWSFGGKGLLIGANVAVALVIAAVICMRLQVIGQKRALPDVAAAPSAWDAGLPAAIPGTPAPRPASAPAVAVGDKASTPVQASGSTGVVIAQTSPGNAPSVASATPASATTPGVASSPAMVASAATPVEIPGLSVTPASTPAMAAAAAATPAEIPGLSVTPASSPATTAAVPAPATIPGLSVTSASTPAMVVAVASTPAPAATPAIAAATPAATPAVPSTPAPALAAAPTPIPGPTPFDIAALAANRTAWPRSVRLKQAIPFPAVLDGRAVGSLTVPAGTTVRLDNMQGGFLVLTFQGGAQRVAWQYTTIAEQMAASSGAIPTAAAQGVTTASNIVSPPTN